MDESSPNRMELKSVIYEEYVMDATGEVSMSENGTIDEGCDKSVNYRNMLYSTVSISSTMCYSQLLGTVLRCPVVANSYGKSLLSSQGDLCNYALRMESFLNVNKNTQGGYKKFLWVCLEVKMN